ncbi:MAG: GTP 3',8-cyclase MoaA [Actinobacteria bacterium]|jgi:GTP 3',8-cyclase|nr:GTP 3',8-cyclase MoaA [Actinomycetota bacterium]MBT5181922.1 GTP 3',8-cyclase MoaA [Actinomycetota bacterium]MBT5502325.1 GTP 3',8-cyclase MoaA [Actinomycetota bacterium]MBT5806244.1 GTP 3',8-cyclase MoaA [Actinomycetota bacterium]HBK38864.1 GTP 3',8-cyclase MoaA [Actinomycetota bacterium]
MGELRMSETTELVDTYGRVHRDLRVSLTDRCSLRCTYCMPADFSDWIANEKLLSTEELVTVIGLCVDAGITQVRLTGGEPLLRRDIADIIRRINELPKAPRISLTTNALRLAEVAQDLKNAGLQRVNVSLDTLDPIRFKEMTHRDRFHDVITGIEAAQAAGLTPLKVNSVLLKGINDDEAIPLLRHALENDWSLRFIEQMPLDAGDLWARPAMVTADEIQSELEREFDLTPVPSRGSAPAEEFYVNGGPATVGIIASVTRPFCAACDRLRLTADGQFRNCLFARDETDVRAVLRSDVSQSEKDAGVRAIIESVTKAKLPGHGINDPDFIKPDRPMSAIGG